MKLTFVTNYKKEDDYVTLTNNPCWWQTVPGECNPTRSYDPSGVGELAENKVRDIKTPFKWDYQADYPNRSAPALKEFFCVWFRALTSF